MKWLVSLFAICAYAPPIEAQLSIPLEKTRGGIELKNIEIRWDDDGYPTTFESTIRVPIPMRNGLVLHFDIGTYGRPEEKPPQGRHVRCGSYEAILPDPIVNDTRVVFKVAHDSLVGDRCEASGIRIRETESLPSYLEAKKRLKDIRDEEIRSREAVIVGCHRTYVSTIDKKQGDLTVRETELIAGCRDAGLYR